MANLTITLEEDLLRRARIRALERGTSVNALLREYLEAFTGTGRTRTASLEALLKLSRAARSARAGRRFTREELHER